MKGRWKVLLTLGGLAATALVYRTFEGDPESRRKKRAREDQKAKEKESGKGTSRDRGSGRTHGSGGP